MEEKILIKGKFSKFNILSLILFLGAVVLIIIGYTTPHLSDAEMGYYFIGAAACLVLALLFWLILGFCAIEVSDKRVCGKAAFGKKVVLPLDKISAVGTSLLKGIAVATSSGRIIFHLCKNRDEVFNVISELLLNRQNNIQSNPAISNADELKKYKDLLDSGVITQEEFDQKKKQLLSL